MNVKAVFACYWLGLGGARYSLLGTILAVAAASALSQDGVTNAGSGPASVNTAVLSAHYPAGSIDSVEKADLALQDAAIQRAAIEARFVAEEGRCQEKFFANACSDAAKESRRAALKLVRAIEIEADGYQRKARVIERDQALAERAAQEELEKPERLKQQQENEAVAAQRAAKANATRPAATETPVPDQRSAQHETKLKRLREEEAANAQKRADNVAEYEAKVKEAQEHQREVAARKQEKEKQGAAKAPAVPAQ